MKDKRLLPPPSEVPEFLHSSPFFPTFEPDEENHIRPPEHMPSILEILKSKPARVAFTFFLALTTFIYFRTAVYEFHVWTRLAGPSCSLSAPVYPPSSWDAPDVDWTKFAYTQYATNLNYLCNSVMIFETLHRLQSKPDRLMLYPSKYSAPDAVADTPERRLLLKARDEYGVKLEAVEVVHEKSALYAGPNWADSYTKLLAFNQTQYSRLLVLDSDSTILQLMDDLFLLPDAKAVMPKAWWLDYPFVTSHIMLIQPSASEFSRIQDAIRDAHLGFYDMEIVNMLYGRECLVLPHKPYALLTGELRSGDHSKWLKGGHENWDPDSVMKQAKLVHFSDHPLPKPWSATKSMRESAQPVCLDGEGQGQGEGCRERKIWMGLYEDFKTRRKNICDM
ncbi:uncharacterized protein L3040_006887 [Drepanopeziza brunnea f. sp. 'multigermtubi']|uniref:Glucose N-acetyltransferase n=1 Tax=Marssonina brunnea f. sp. multigermtubi (strain MB_m1) TaxID=1072389 RepID=K1WIS8_MARBU|nr:uncharacterized protein MBM_08965 [Drepanopeziza brunnea f. sp. 'multigermtubi' MB_m1]EKD12736.1 hypothetical protein MBM_08965 [Drepanopeziza brunnea f. sp. 'multigermtubi' MB_m1]KAJ5038013.1 hypothetical protein L3040_006887 [Drepanopeziza brunnea f. sp. 'multigermtubi']